MTYPKLRWKKDTGLVYTNQELVGTWTNGQWDPHNIGRVEGGFLTPMDVAFDEANDQVLYMVAVNDNCVWKIVINDINTGDVVVSVLAGTLLL